MRRALFGMTVVLVLAACGREASPPSAVEGATVEAQVMTVTPEPIKEAYTTTGTLIAEDRVEIASRLMGYIRSIGVREGDQVKQGQLLVTIDPTEIQAQLSEARARAAQAKASVAEAKTDFERNKTLFEQKLIAANAYTKAELAYQLAQEELRAAEATLDRVQVQLQYAEIRAPVSGIVVEKQRRAGDIATPGAPILTIENPDNILLRTYIREEHLRDVQPGDTVAITIDAADLETTGVITQLVPSGDPATHSYLVKATLDRLDGARAGMFARADFAIGSKIGILIPSTALVSRSDLPGVYVVSTEGTAHFRMVRTGRSIGAATEILSGLQAGDRIVVHAAAPLHTGDHVQEANAPEAATDSREGVRTQ